MGTCFHYGDKLLNKQIAMLKTVDLVAVIGSGTMGVGIAIDILNKTSHQVLLIDIADAALDKARRTLQAYFGGLAKAGRMLPEDVEAVLCRVKTSKDYASLADAQIIWEVATERIDVKKAIFKQIEKHAVLDKLVLIFSNTSSHTTAELAGLFSDNLLRENFLTGHGYFPFHANRLFDVMKGKYASEAAFQRGIAFAEQILEKKVIALANDHHGYIADPIFEGMGAILSWDIKTARDLVELPLVFQMMAANPFEVLDRTGHMPYTEMAKHMGTALPKSDRLGGVYSRKKRNYPQWIGDLETARRGGLAAKDKEGFFKWEGSEGREKPVAVYDPAKKRYVPIPEPDWNDFWSIKEAEALDKRNATIKSIEGLIHVSEAGDRGGKAFRRYFLPFLYYSLDLIQDGHADAGQINSSTKVGLRFKFGLCEIIDGFLKHYGLDGFMALAKRAAAENPDLAELYDVEGISGPRKGKPCLLGEMKKKGWDSLLGYGRIYGTPVSQRNFKTGKSESYYNDLKFVPPNSKDRTASVIFDNPLKGNVWNRYTLDQLDHAVGICAGLYENGELGSILFTASGTGMRMLGADARQFNKGWFDARTGYRYLGKDESAYFTKAGMALFRFLQESPIWTVGVFGEKWGGGAEFTYFLDQRFDLRSEGVEFDTLSRKSLRRQKKNYNQPEINYAILGGFGAVGELRRLGFGDSVIDEIFMQGMTADRAHQLGLANGVDTGEYRLLERAFEVARLTQKFSAPYSAALYGLQKRDAFAHGIDDAKLVEQTAETFDPEKNPYVSTGLLRLLNMGGSNPPLDMKVKGKLPGWNNNYQTLFD